MYFLKVSVMPSKMLQIVCVAVHPFRLFVEAEFGWKVFDMYMTATLRQLITSYYVFCAMPFDSTSSMFCGCSLVVLSGLMTAMILVSCNLRQQNLYTK